MGQSDLPKISAENKKRIRKMVSEHSTLYLRNATIEIEIHYTEICKSMRGELRLFLYK